MNSILTSLDVIQKAAESGLPPKFREKSHDRLALMFCYFNHLEYFKQYMESYRGSVLILIGPINGRRHCDPEPMFLKENPQSLGENQKWRLVATHDVRAEGEDMVAIYHKSSQNF